MSSGGRSSNHSRSSSSSSSGSSNAGALEFKKVVPNNRGAGARANPNTLHSFADMLKVGGSIFDGPRGPRTQKKVQNKNLGDLHNILQHERTRGSHANPKARPARRGAVGSSVLDDLVPGLASAAENSDPHKLERQLSCASISSEDQNLLQSLGRRKSISGLDDAPATSSPSPPQHRSRKSVLEMADDHLTRQHAQFMHQPSGSEKGTASKEMEAFQRAQENRALIQNNVDNHVENFAKLTSFELIQQGRKPRSAAAVSRLKVKMIPKLRESRLKGIRQRLGDAFMHTNTTRPEVKKQSTVDWISSRGHGGRSSLQLTSAPFVDKGKARLSLQLTPRASADSLPIRVPNERRSAETTSNHDDKRAGLELISEISPPTSSLAVSNAGSMVRKSRTSPSNMLLFSSANAQADDITIDVNVQSSSDDETLGDPQPPDNSPPACSLPDPALQKISQPVGMNLAVTRPSDQPTSAENVTRSSSKPAAENAQPACQPNSDGKATLDKIIQKFSSAGDKNKMVEIPRLKSRFHPREGRILNDMFQKNVKTERRLLDAKAEELGLKLCEYNVVNYRMITDEDLKSAVLNKVIMQRKNAALFIEAIFQAKLLRRVRKKREIRRNAAASRIQSWWRRLDFIIAVQRKARQNLRERKAATKMQAFARGRIARSEILLKLELFSLKYRLDAMEAKLNVIPLKLLVRIQAIARRQLARKHVGRLVAARRIAAEDVAAKAAEEMAAARAAAAAALAEEEELERLRLENEQLIEAWEADDILEEARKDSRSFKTRSSVMSRSSLFSTSSRAQRASKLVGGRAGGCTSWSPLLDVLEDDDGSCPSTRAPTRLTMSSRSSCSPSRGSPDGLTPTPPPGGRPGRAPPQRPHTSCSEDRPTPSIPERPHSSCSERSPLRQRRHIHHGHEYNPSWPRRLLLANAPPTWTPLVTSRSPTPTGMDELDRAPTPIQGRTSP